MKYINGYTYLTYNNTSYRYYNINNDLRIGEITMFLDDKFKQLWYNDKTLHHQDFWSKIEQEYPLLKKFSKLDYNPEFGELTIKNYKYDNEII